MIQKGNHFPCKIIHKQILEKALALYLEGELSKLGIESDVYSPDEVEGIMEMEDYLAGRNLKDRTNITGKIKGKSSKKALMLATERKALIFIV